MLISHQAFLFKLLQIDSLLTYIICCVTEMWYLALTLAFPTGSLPFRWWFIFHTCKSSFPCFLCFSCFLLHWFQCFAHSRCSPNIWGSLDCWMNKWIEELTKEGTNKWMYLVPREVGEREAESLCATSLFLYVRHMKMLSCMCSLCFEEHSQVG